METKLEKKQNIAGNCWEATIWMIGKDILANNSSRKWE
jgi:hypothetical protein